MVSALLNSVLDQSKMDAGKMKLEEETFDLGQLLEDVVDSFHARAMAKGLEVILDPVDGSLNKFSRVKGDQGKLKQVLINLLSNAIKFTSKGNVTVRAWVQKPCQENSIISPNPQEFSKHLSSCLFFRNKKAQSDLEAVNSVKNNPNTMEYVFEVDDTGRGIPGEKRESVFENYVQVKHGEGGTGLGLGIVQSLVRLMGGDIKIVDKPNGEEGTCFKFNIFLTAEEFESVDNTRTDIETGLENHTPQNRGLTVLTQSPSQTQRSNSAKLTSLLSPKAGSSLVVHLIGNEERRRITHKYLQQLGISAASVDRFASLKSAMRMKTKHQSSSSCGKLEFSFRKMRDVPLMSTLEGTEERDHTYKRGNRGPNFVLLVIDAASGQIQDLSKVVSEIRREIGCYCRVVWLDKPTLREQSKI